MREVNGQVLDRLVELNALRSIRAPCADRRTELENWFAEAFLADQRLATYGSLAPGRVNHNVVAPIVGTWTLGLTTTGHLVASGWGATIGFPALRWDPSGPAVVVAMLTSPMLPGHWARLDAFEGPEYVRVLIPLSGESGFETIANLYQLAARVEPRE